VTIRTRPPRAVTFDFWYTLFVPGGDTVRLRARRLAGPLRASEEAVLEALADALAVHNAEWRAGRLWGACECAELLLRRFPGAASDVRPEVLTHLVEVSAVDGGEHPVEGAVEVVRRLREAGVSLGIVSDTGLTPGRVLRGFLDRAGLLAWFEPASLAFSDEVGVPKPSARIFGAALSGLRARPADVVHVGDLRATDVAGARAIGMGSVRFAGGNDDPRDGPEADVVIGLLSELPAVLGLA
jgi:putative hydrolase of the HAD superfamily